MPSKKFHSLPLDLGLGFLWLPQAVCWSHAYSPGLSLSLQNAWLSFYVLSEYIILSIIFMSIILLFTLLTLFTQYMFWKQCKGRALFFMPSPLFSTSQILEYLLNECILYAYWMNSILYKLWNYLASVYKLLYRLSWITSNIPVLVTDIWKKRHCKWENLWLNQQLKNTWL